MDALQQNRVPHEQKNPQRLRYALGIEYPRGMVCMI